MTLTTELAVVLGSLIVCLTSKLVDNLCPSCTTFCFFLISYVKFNSEAKIYYNLNAVSSTVYNVSPGIKMCNYEKVQVEHEA